MLYTVVGRKISTMPRYTGLKDFVRGCQKLLKIHGNIPVFLQVDGRVAPFGMAVQSSCLFNGEAMLLLGGESKGEGEMELFEPGDCTD